MNLSRAKFVAAFVVVGVLVVFGITFTASPTPKSLSTAANQEESVVTKKKKYWWSVTRFPAAIPERLPNNCKWP